MAPVTAAHSQQPFSWRATQLFLIARVVGEESGMLQGKNSWGQPATARTTCAVWSPFPKVLLKGQDGIRPDKQSWQVSFGPGAAEWVALEQRKKLMVLVPQNKLLAGFIIITVIIVVCLWSLRDVVKIYEELKAQVIKQHVLKAERQAALKTDSCKRQSNPQEHVRFRSSSQSILQHLTVLECHHQSHYCTLNYSVN